MGIKIDINTYNTYNTYNIYKYTYTLKKNFLIFIHIILKTMKSKRIVSGANGILFVDPSSQRTRSIRKRTNHAQPQLQTLKQLYKAI